MNPKWKWMGLVLAVFVVFGVTGCASTPRPYTYHDDRDEKPGPGLFSGEEGGIVVYGKKKGVKEPGHLSGD
jgi:hypothetical protein